MKNNKQRKIIAMLLVLCMCVTAAVPASAATTSRFSTKSISSSWTDFWNRIFGGANGNTGNGSDTGSSDTGNGSTDEESDPELTLVEDETTVEEGTMLRASTYSTGAASDDGISTTSVEAGDVATSSDKLVYFPVTMFNYSANVINNVTHQAELNSDSNLRKWNGIYFNTGKPSNESCVYIKNSDDETSNVWKSVNLNSVDSEKTYVIVGYRGQALTGTYKNSKGAISGTATGVSGGTLLADSNNAMSGATKWSIAVSNDGKYCISASISSRTRYMDVGNGSVAWDTDKVSLTIEDTGDGDNSVYIGNGTYWLNQNGGPDSTTYLGWNGKDDGSKFYIYELQTVQGVLTTSDALGYANWNFWTGAEVNGSHKGYIYGGLVENTLDENGQIQFTVPEGGIFDASDTTTKKVYTNVGLPFVYDEETGYYTFDASQDSARFASNATSDTLLTWNDTAQTNTGADTSGSKNGFYPFNNELSFGSADYHFGMAASVSFNMTANGQLNDKDIEFQFAGDDDVWVFIDGVLVLDLGGIHDSVSGNINFADNTVKFKATSDSTSSGDISGKTTDSTAGAGEWLNQAQLFNNSNGNGILGQTLATFAATTNHTLTVYYLERGQGSSNCKISFNLPQYDYISVTKSLDNTMYDSKNGSASGTVSDALMESLLNVDYSFTAYGPDKDEDGKADALAGYQYITYNANGESVGTGYTSENGTFTVKLNQTVRIIIDNLDGEYYVTETLGNAYGQPSWNDNGKAANSYQTNKFSSGYTSAKIEADGSEEATDYINFTCTNKLLTPVADIQNETVVIDYGIPDEINVLSNDTFTGDGTLALSGLSSTIDGNFTEKIEGTYGTAEIKNGKVVYTLTKQLTGIENIYYNVILASEDDISEASSMGVGILTIVPATSMYYEEDFNELVEYSTGAATWRPQGTSDDFYQEEGKVGNSNDSPYGSDTGYLKNTEDSYGTSKYVSTSSAAAKFSYRFTGTGTSFFARTGENTGYMYVVVKDNEGNQVHKLYRDTIYRAVDGTDFGTLYNVPVYTVDGLEYGTYTVEVIILKGTEMNGFGSDFYLDGIRIVNPMNPTAANYTIATDAYAADGEANNTVVTLRDKLLNDYAVDTESGGIAWVGEGAKFVLLTDNNGEVVDADEYKSAGPKEEVYLYDGQSITFSLKNWDADANRLYIGMKAPAAGNSIVYINGHEVQVSNTTDCYYYIPKNYANIATDDEGNVISTFTISAAESKLISITNLKVTGNVEFAICIPKDEDIEGGGE